MRALIVYATRQGLTRRIAMRLADDLVARSIPVDVFDADTPRQIDWSRYFSVCLAASVHLGHHEKEMIAFVRAHTGELERLQAAFISVSLSEATAEDPHKSDVERQRAAADVQKMIDDFVQETGWQPARTLPVAGALAYSKYNMFVRFLMKRIARKAGAPTDTSHDYEFTNWQLVDEFATELAPVGLRR
jgi:menaquinone-dependent protoporphyrinogen oxidase